MRFTLNASKITIDLNRWKTRMDQDLSENLDKAAGAWINSIVFSVVPVWSGASVATFLKLAKEVNHPLEVRGVSTKLGGGVSLGLSRSKGEVTKNKNLGHYTFTYKTNLFHLVFNEQFNANDNPKAGKLFARLRKPGPYNFREIGKEAFESYSREVKLPSPWKTLKRSKITVK